MDVAILDYGAGNLTSVAKAFAACGAGVRIASDAGSLAGAEALVVPGVGHFDRTRVIDSDTRGAVLDAARRGVPLLGICLGMHWLFEGSAEAPGTPGLGLFRGRCHALTAGAGLKVPHAGWNTLDGTGRPSRLIDDASHGRSAYFTHTFAAPLVAETTATTTHGSTFPAVVERGRVFATQFHPEKSGAVGLACLANFLRAAREAR
jgi:glutamine amidotransferase